MFAELQTDFQSATLVLRPYSYSRNLFSLHYTESSEYKALPNTSTDDDRIVEMNTLMFIIKQQILTGRRKSQIRKRPDISRASSVS